MIDAIIFDLDGVIVDTAKYHFRAWQRLAAHLDIHFTPEDNERMKGISRSDSLDKLLALGGKSYSERDKQKFCLIKNTWYLELTQNINPSGILPGIVAFLDHLESEGIKLALGSASKNARKILDAVKLTHRFDVIVDGNDVSKSKPDPEVFLKGAQALGIAPQHIIVVEDSAKGIDAAISGGFLTVGLGSEDHLSHADIVLPSLEHITLGFLQSHISKTVS